MTSQIHSECFAIHGHGLGHGFAEWVAAHGRKLGLEFAQIETSDERLQFRASGLPDMLDAMEMGCSLGPISVSVARIDRMRLSG